MKLRTAIPVLSLFGGLLLSGCAALTGTVGVGVERNSDAYIKLAEAMTHARSVLTAIDEKQNELDEVRGFTSAGLYAAGTGAGAAGIFGGSDDIIKGFVVAAGGILGIVDYAQVAQKWGILENGKEAIFCSIEQAGALYVKKEGSTILEDLSGRIQSQFLPAMDTATFRALDKNVKLSASFTFGAIKAHGFSVIQKVQVAFATLPDEVTLARTLTLTVERIRAEIEKQLRAASPDPQQIFSNQRQRMGQMVANSERAFSVAITEGRQARAFLNATALLAKMPNLGFASLGLPEVVGLLAEEEMAPILKTLKDVADCLNTVTLMTPAPNEP